MLIDHELHQVAVLVAHLAQTGIDELQRCKYLQHARPKGRLHTFQSRKLGPMVLQNLLKPQKSPLDFSAILDFVCQELQ